MFGITYLKQLNVIISGIILLSQFKNIPKKIENIHLMCVQIQDMITKHSVPWIKVLACTEQKLPSNSDKPASI